MLLRLRESRAARSTEVVAYSARVRSGKAKSTILLILGILLLIGSRVAFSDEPFATFDENSSKVKTTKAKVSRSKKGEVSRAVPVSYRRSEGSKADTSEVARESAIQSIPFERLTKSDRQRVLGVLSGKPIFRRMPVHVCQCDPELYHFLVQHPDLVVGIWEELDITELRMRQIEPGRFATRDGDGTVGTVEMLYQDSETSIVLADGKYNGTLLTKSVEGRTLLVLKTGYVRSSDGKYYITSRLDSFTQIDNVAFELLTKTLHPILGRIADYNFVQTSAFVGQISQAAESGHSRLQYLAENLNQVDDTTREEFLLLTSQIAQKAERHQDGPVPVAWQTDAKDASQKATIR